MMKLNDIRNKLKNQYIPKQFVITRPITAEMHLLARPEQCEHINGQYRESCFHLETEELHALASASKIHAGF